MQESCVYNTCDNPQKMTNLTTKIIRKVTACDVLVVLNHGKKWNGKQYKTDLGKEINTAIKARFDAKDFTGEKGKILSLYAPIKGVKRLELVGMKKTPTKAEIRTAMEAAAKRARATKAKKMAVLVPDSYCIEMTLSGVNSGNYVYKLGDQSEVHQLNSLSLLTHKKLGQEFMDMQAAEADATALIRYMVDAPTNHMRPAGIAAEAKKLEEINKKMKVTVMGEKELTKERFHALLEVGRGSDSESHAAVMVWNGGKKGDAPIAFVGKGVAYDTGGYNLKPTGHIETMKCDMGGAATVVGLMHYIAKMQPKVNVVAIVGCVQNDISGHAYYPGDVINSRAGKTIKVTNTDAEGRLVMADCIDYVKEKYKPARLYDAATLTGAVTVALGYEYTGLMGNSKKLIAEMTNLGATCGEQYWELPLDEYHKSKTKGDICDLFNWTKGTRAGASMAAAFLSNFIGDTPWVHADIAGTAFNGKYGQGGEEGATGTLLRTWRRVVEASQ